MPLRLQFVASTWKYQPRALRFNILPALHRHNSQRRQSDARNKCIPLILPTTRALPQIQRSLSSGFPFNEQRRIIVSQGKTPLSVMEVVHEPELNQFSLSLEGLKEPAVLRYRLQEADGVTVYDMYSTFVPDSMRGQGIAGKLVKFACEFAREKGYKIIPTCPYIPVYLKRNPSDTDVVLTKE